MIRAKHDSGQRISQRLPSPRREEDWYDVPIGTTIEICSECHYAFGKNKHAILSYPGCSKWKEYCKTYKEMKEIKERCSLFENDDRFV